MTSPHSQPPLPGVVPDPDSLTCAIPSQNDAQAPTPAAQPRAAGGFCDDLIIARARVIAAGGDYHSRKRRKVKAEAQRKAWVHAKAACAKVEARYG